MPFHRSTRRRFLQSSIALGAGFLTCTPSRRTWAKSRWLNEQIQFACIGVGGKGKEDSSDAARHGQVLGICDVDTRTLDQVGSQEGFLEAKRFFDFREMLSDLGSTIDAVTVSTPDHTHAVAAAMAMNMGKHCFCQKPLTRTIYEARYLGELARKAGVKTEMGNQGTARDELRRGAAVLRTGVLGEIHHVHIWTNRPVWPQGIDRPAEEPVPDYLHWDQWIGPAPFRPYSAAYHPFKWRGFWDFGSGALGDMGCHTLNMTFMGLELRGATAVTAEKAQHNKETFPGSSRIVYEFPKRGSRSALKMTWYDGGERPEPELITKPMIDWLVGQHPDQKIEDPVELMTSGVLVVGEHGTLFAPGDYGDNYKLFGVEEPKVEFEPSPGHFTEFADAIDGGPDAVSNIPDYAGPLTETILLGNLAVWSGKRVELDPQKLVPTNAPELMFMVKPKYREGYSLDQVATTVAS